MIRTAAARRGVAPRGGAAATTPVDGLSVSYHTSGNVELHRHTLVFIHGGGGDARLWRRQLPYFAHSCYCVAIDLVGHGRSEGGGAENVPEYARSVCRFLDALAIRQPVVLVGHQLGGMIALQLAVSDPARVRGLVLVATGARLPVRSEWLAALGRGESVDGLLLGLFAPGTPGEVLRDEVKHWHAARPEVRFGDFLACDRFDCTERIGSLQTRTLVVGGEADPFTPPPVIQQLHERIVGSQLVLIPGAGHYVMLEQPEAFNAQLDAFLEGF